MLAALLCSAPPEPLLVPPLALHAKSLPACLPKPACPDVPACLPACAQVLDAANGTLLWTVDQKLLGIYPYTPTVMAGGEAVAVHNCLDVVAPNSLCVYSPPVQQPAPPPEEPAGAQSTAASPPPPPASSAPSALAGWPAAGLVGAGPMLRVLLAAGAAAALLLLF